MEEALKQREMLQEFRFGERSTGLLGRRSATAPNLARIIGFREHVFTHNVSSVANFFSLQVRWCDDSFELSSHLFASLAASAAEGVHYKACPLSKGAQTDLRHWLLQARDYAQHIGCHPIVFLPGLRWCRTAVRPLNAPAYLDHIFCPVHCTNVCPL